MATPAFRIDASGQLIDGFSYASNAAGQLISEADIYPGVSLLAGNVEAGDSAMPGPSDPTASYTYDATGQLIGDGTQSYTYDANGNRTNPSDMIGRDNQVLADGTWTYTYDAEGNRIGKVDTTTGVSWTYAYDDANRLTSATETSGQQQMYKVSYVYDVFGNRIEQDTTTPGQDAPTVQRFAYNGAMVWADLNAQNQVTTRYLDGDAVDQLLAREDAAGNVGWYLTDHLGSVRDIVDNFGDVLDHIDYDAFGNVTIETNPALGDRYKFTGREYDATTGLYYNRARYYDPNTGNWTSQDPSGFDGRDANTYRAVGGSPTNGTDPLGLAEPDINQVTERMRALHNDAQQLLDAAVQYNMGVEFNRGLSMADRYDYDKESNNLLINQYTGVYPFHGDRSVDDMAEAMYQGLQRYVGEHTLGTASKNIYNNTFGNGLATNHGVTADTEALAAQTARYQGNPNLVRITGNVIQVDIGEKAKETAGTLVLGVAGAAAKAKFAEAAKAPTNKPSILGPVRPYNEAKKARTPGYDDHHLDPPLGRKDPNYSTGPTIRVRNDNAGGKVAGGVNIHTGEGGFQASLRKHITEDLGFSINQWNDLTDSTRILHLKRYYASLGIPFSRLKGESKMLDNLQKLIGTFYRDIHTAKGVITPNAEDNLVIKAAITGFSYNSPVDDWAKGHFEFVKTRIDRDYASEELAEYGNNSENIKLFFALSIGFLLGVYQKGGISDEDFKIAEQQIPGLIMLHLASLTSHNV